MDLEKFAHALEVVLDPKYNGSTTGYAYAIVQGQDFDNGVYGAGGLRSSVLPRPQQESMWVEVSDARASGLHFTSFPPIHRSPSSAARCRMLAWSKSGKYW